MSHFKILVIGDKVDEQLAPYDENKETEAYKVEDYDHAEKVAAARKFYNENPRHRPEGGVDIANERALLGWYCQGEDIRWVHKGDGEWVSEEWSTYNPNSKWDYFTIGGRYNAWFKIKADANPDDFHPSEAHWSEKFGNDANHANASDKAMKRAIDFPAMIAARRAAAEADWAKLSEATEGIEPPAYGWAECLEKHGIDNIDAARKEWNTHPWNVEARNAGFWDPYEDFQMRAEDPRATYIARAEDLAVTGFYAVLKDGEWIARGEMGWFGISNDTVSETDWSSKVRELIEELPEDTWLTNIDCHI